MAAERSTTSGAVGVATETSVASLDIEASRYATGTSTGSAFRSAAGRSRASSFISTLTHDDWFGSKTIGMFGGVALLINNITGPGVPSLPNMFAEAGWLFPTVCFMAVWFMTSLSTGMYCEAMRRIPGNDHFKGRVEYTSIVKYYFGRAGYIASQIGVNGALQSLNIISVVQSAQVLDNLITTFFGRSCAVNLSPFSNSVNGTIIEASTEFWSCMDTNNPLPGSAWGCHIVISAGLVAALVIALPMGYFNLDDNIGIQVGAFIATLACWAVWFVACWFAEPISTGNWAIPAVNNTPGVGSQAGVVGTILFNFGFVTTVPSWVNEKKPSVSVNKSVWLSTFLCNVIFFMIGIPGAMAFQAFLQGPATNTCAHPDINGNCASDLMAVLTSPKWSPFEHGTPAATIVAISSYLFPVVAVLSSIPVFSIVIKYNCIENGFSHTFSFLWGVVAPWIIAIPLLYQPNALNQFISFSSLIFVSFTDFIVPFTLYIILTRQDQKDDRLGLAAKALADGHMSPASGTPTATSPDPAAARLLADARGTHATDTTDLYGSGTSGSRFTSHSSRPGLKKSSSSFARLRRHLAELPLLPQRPEDEGVADTEHFAFPSVLDLAHSTRGQCAVCLVLVMTAVSIAGIVLSIQTSVTTTWDCAAVGAS